MHSNFFSIIPCLYLVEKLSVYDHINAKISKANKGSGITKRLLNTLSRNFLLIIYKSFIRPYLDYCEIIYDQPNNESVPKLNVYSTEQKQHISYSAV